MREGDENPDEAKIQRGITKNLLTQWKTKSNDEFKPKRQSIILNEDEGFVAENEPSPRRDDVVREDLEDNEQVGEKNSLRPEQSAAN